MWVFLQMIALGTNLRFVLSVGANFDSRFVRTSWRITVLTFLLNTNISHVIKVLGAKF